MCLRNSETVNVTELESIRKRIIGGEIRDVTGTKSHGDFGFRLGVWEKYPLGMPIERPG